MRLKPHTCVQNSLNLKLFFIFLLRLLLISYIKLSDPISDQFFILEIAKIFLIKTLD